MTLTQLPSLLWRCLALLEHELTARRITFFIGPEYEHPAILADPHQLEQVFLNLLMNAMEAMPNGGRVTISTSLREREGHPFVEIQIADTGGRNSPRAFGSDLRPLFHDEGCGQGNGPGTVGELRDREGPRGLHRSEERGWERQHLQRRASGELARRG